MYIPLYKYMWSIPTFFQQKLSDFQVWLSDFNITGVIYISMSLFVHWDFDPNEERRAHCCVKLDFEVVISLYR